MRNIIFQAIIVMLKTCTKFAGEDGTVRVYDWATTAPGGYPYVVVGSESLESVVLDNARDARLYNFTIQVVGEKFGEQGAMTQSQAMQAMRDTEDAVLTLFDTNNDLSIPANVIYCRPMVAKYGFTDNNARVVLTITLKVLTTVNITL